MVATFKQFLTELKSPSEVVDFYNKVYAKGDMKRLKMLLQSEIVESGNFTGGTSGTYVSDMWAAYDKL